MGTLHSPFRATIFRRILLAWALALFAGVGLAAIDIGGELEQRLRDFRSENLDKPATGDIVIVEIDSKSLQATGRWPWPRDYYAKAIDRLSAAGVKQIAFKVDLSTYSDPGQDQDLADAIARSNSLIILPTFRPNETSVISQYIENLPAKTARKNVVLASINFDPDNRGQLNRYSYGTNVGGVERPSLASMIAGKTGEVGENFIIDQSINPGTIPRISFIDVINGRIDATALAGKRVLIGPTAIELGDRFPLSRFGVVPGVVIQALAAETLLQGTNIEHLGEYPPLVAVALLLLGLILVRSLDHRSLTMLIAIIVILLFLFLLATEYLNLFTYSNVPTFFFLGTFLVLRELFSTALALQNSQYSNVASRLPNEQAMEKYIKTRGPSYIATARLTNFNELLVVTNQASRLEIFNSLSDRLRFLAQDELIFHLDIDILAWVMKDEYIDDIAGHFDSAGVLFQAPVIADETKIKVNATFGCSDTSIDKSKVASEQACAKGIKWLSHDDDVDLAIGHKLNLLVELDQAIEERKLTVVYQPKWNLLSGELNGAEVLVRWTHPEQGVIGPATFIPMLEKAGRIDSLTYFVLEQALHDMGNWNKRRKNLHCSVNISAQLLSDSNFVDKAIAMVDAAPIDNGQIVFEVTETASMVDSELSIYALSRIRDAGIKLSIDDYGTGQSTMSYLQRLPINELKIDQSFIKTISTDNANRVMVDSTIKMAHALGFEVVAEGIEDQPCMDLLIKMGCDIGQGWHISRPMPTEIFEEEWLDIDEPELQHSA